MATKVKGLLKGIKYISQLFVYKDHEMEIGYPTDVKHVSHVGWDGESGSAPSWISDFSKSSDFSTASFASFGQSRETSWASQDFDRQRELQPSLENFGDNPCPDIPKAPKKSKRRRNKASSPSSSARSSRSSKSRTSFSTAIEEPNQVQNEHRMV